MSQSNEKLHISQYMRQILHLYIFLNIKSESLENFKYLHISHHKR